MPAEAGIQRLLCPTTRMHDVSVTSCSLHYALRDSHRTFKIATGDFVTGMMS